MYRLSHNLGIDLGTANVLIYSEGKGIVLREPSVVAVDKNDGKVISVGSDARSMMGRTPGNVEAVRPLHSGVISDYDMTQKLLSACIRKVTGYTLVKPRVVISVPSAVTEVEERALIQAAMEAGARRVYLIEEPLAAALGAGLDMNGPQGNMVVDIGGGLTDLAVLSMNDVAVSSSLKFGGDTFDETVIAFVRRHFGILIGENTAEEIKIAIGTVAEREDDRSMQVKGRDLKTGLPREATISSSDLLDGFRRAARVLLDEILSLLEKTAPELVADLSRNGIVLTGGGSQLRGLAELITQRTELPCRVAEDPDICVAVGCGKSLQWLHSMQEGPIKLARRKLMQDV